MTFIVGPAAAPDDDDADADESRFSDDEVLFDSFLDNFNEERFDFLLLSSTVTFEEPSVIVVLLRRCPI